MMNKKIQDKWKESFVVGHDCITYGDGRIVMGNAFRVKDSETNKVTQHWYPLCDTTLEGVQKYEEDVWTEVDVFHGTFSYENQTFVFGDGGMGNEGYVASLNLNGELNWSVFFTFSNPIDRAKIEDDYLICCGDTGTVVKINLEKLTDIKVSYEERA